MNNKEYMLDSNDNNVVKLHKEVSTEQLNSIQESMDIATQMKLDLCEDITELCMEQLMSMCSSYGIFNNSKRFDHRDIIMIENAIEAAIHRHYGLKHPLHEVTESVFCEEGEE